MGGMIRGGYERTHERIHKLHEFKRSRFFGSHALAAQQHCTTRKTIAHRRRQEEGATAALNSAKGAPTRARPAQEEVALKPRRLSRQSPLSPMHEASDSSWASKSSSPCVSLALAGDPSTFLSRKVDGSCQFRSCSSCAEGEKPTVAACFACDSIWLL